MSTITNKMLTSTSILEKALDASALRNDVISQNIANIDTPSYKRKSVSFEETLSSAMEGGLAGIRTNSRHIPIGEIDPQSAEIKINQDNKTLSMRLDGNNVDIDNEMALLAKNSIKYNFLVQSINGYFNKIKSVISEGRR